MPGFSLRQFAALSALCLAGGGLCAQVQAGPGQNPPPNPFQNLPTRTVHLQGVVVSSLDGKPVSRALVSSVDGRFAALTDWQGHFSFDYRLPDAAAAAQQFPGLMQSAQILRFSLKKPGYVSDGQSVKLPAFDPSGPAPVLQLKISPCGVLVGHVSMDSGERPQNFYVQLRRRQVQDGLGTWVTAGARPVNSDGEFRFSDLAPGDYQVMTSAWVPQNSMRPQQQRPDIVRGLLPAYSPEPSAGAGVESVHVGPGEITTANVTPHWANFYFVSLPVSGMQPGRNFGISLIPNQAGYNVRVNPATHTVEGYLPSGTYAVRITEFNGNGGPVARQPMQGRTPQNSGVAHFQVGSAPVLGPALTPAPGADIQVNITRNFSNQQNGNNLGAIRQGPLVYLNLQPVDNQGLLVGNPPNPGEQGDSFTLHDVAEGVYRLNLNAMQGYVASATSGNTDLLREPLTVGESSAPSIDITVRDDPAMLIGRVITGETGGAQEESDPVFVLCIPLDRPQSQAIMSAWTPQWGFRSPPLPPGRYLLVASREQLFRTIEYRNPEVLRTMMSKGAVITLSAGQKAEVDIPLMPEGAS